jgi:hypothetical protein
MELLTGKAARSWCETRNVIVNDDAIPSGRLSLSEDAFQVRVNVPHEALPSIALAYVLVMTGLVDDEEENFEGGLLWLMDWDIGSETTERVGLRLLRAVRDGDAGFLAKPAQLFTTTEFVDANTALSLPALFQWDAFFVPASGTTLVFVSHEGYVQLTCRGQLEYKRLASRFRHGNWG